jgi:SAM-dependent methyltransferase
MSLSTEQVTGSATPTATPNTKSSWGFGAWRSSIYDRVIVSFTAKWYASVLSQLADGSRLLDVGVGTGAALVANADLIRAKNLTVVGVDYDTAYIRRCNTLIEEHKLGAHVSAVCCSFYDYAPTPSDPRLFDHVYFSGSFMILPESAAALRKAVDLLRDREDGRLYFTQTFELRKNTLLEWVKPTMTYWTTIDFGNVTYVEDFDSALADGDVVAVSATRIADGKTVEDVRESRLVVARSTIYVPEISALETLS